MNYFKAIAILTCSVFVLISVSGLKAQYIPEEQIIYAHETVTLTLPEAETLTIVYRPGSNISDTVRIHLKDSAYQWTPREAGIVALTTPEGPLQTVSVRFENYPFWGFFIMFGAAFVLFGGATYASIKLFGEETTDEVASRPRYLILLIAESHAKYILSFWFNKS